MDATKDVLSPLHRKMLSEESGISDEVITARGYRTITDHKELSSLGFSRGQLRNPGLLLPLHATDGSQPFSVYRPDFPREREGKVVKYEMLKGQGMRLDCPPTCRPALADPKIPLWLTEGQKKADALASRGACAIALLGVWNFKGKNAFGGTTVLADWDYIALKDREVRIVFDNDVTREPEVRKALERLTEHLQRKRAHVSVVYLPLDGPKGVDEYLVSGKTLSELEALIEGPRPQPKPARPIAELLEHEPSTLRRPLALIDGRAYAAIWPYIKVTRTETTDKAGNIVTLNPPEVTTAQRLHIVRDDGHIFGDGGDETLSESGLTVALEMTPPTGRLWQTPAVNVYRAGKRPDPCTLFRSLSAVYDSYLDFSRSLGSQSDMCDFSACLSMMTWFSEVYDVLPYPWANGEWGSGKTKWGTLWTATSYLGEVLTMGGTFAALRDLADYGATLLFDDAETIDDKKTDPEKKALLLAGNRRGARVPLKEQNGDRSWKIRWVNAFCPRGFTAKKRPNGALATRSLLIPLVKTADTGKGNRDPVREEGWPIPQRALQDDLWATALMLLSDAKRVWSEFDKEITLVGRTFEVWRAPFAVARLFERLGIEGLEARMRNVMEASMGEKREEPADHTTKVVQAIGCLIFGVSDVSDVSDKSDVCREGFTAEEVRLKIVELAEADQETDWATTRSLGWTFNSLRLPKKKDTSTKKSARYREVSKALALQLLYSHGLLTRKTSETSETSETSDNNGAHGANGAETENSNAGNAGNAYQDETAPDDANDGATTYRTSETSDEEDNSPFDTDSRDDDCEAEL